MKKIYIAISLIAFSLIASDKLFSQGCDNATTFQDKTLDDFPGGIPGHTDWYTFGVFDDSGPECDDCRSPYDDDHPNCASQSTDPGGYAKSQCTAWAFFRTGYAGSGDGGFWAENLPDCPANITGATTCRSRTPARGTLMSKIGTREPDGRISNSGHIAVVECAYQENNEWRIQISQFNADTCEFSAVDRPIREETYYDPDELWFIYRYDANGDLIPLPGSCNQIPEIKHALTTGKDSNACEVDVKISLNGSICPETDHYVLHKKAFHSGETNPYFYTSEVIEKNALFNFTTDKLSGLDPCSRIVYQLEQVIANVPNLSVWSEERPAINLSMPNDISDEIITPGSYSNYMKVDWSDVCPDFSGTKYDVNCACSNPDYIRSGTVYSSSFSGYFYKNTQYQCQITAFNDGDKSKTAYYTFQTDGDEIPLPVAPTIIQDKNLCNELIINWLPVDYTSAFKYVVSIYYKPNNSPDFALVTSDDISSSLTNYSWTANRGDGLYGATIKVVEIPSGEDEPKSSNESSMAQISIDCISEIPVIQNISTEFCQGVTLEWSFNSAKTVENIESYEVWRNGEKISPDNFRSTSYTDVTAENNRWTSYRVRVNYTDNDYITDRHAVSYPRSIYTKTPPPPSELISYESIGKKVEITFDNIPDVDSFFVTRNPQGGQFIPSKHIISHTSNADLTFSDFVYFNGDGRFRYQFKSIKDGCFSPENSPFYTIIALQKPTSLAIGETTENSLTLTWNTAPYSPEGTQFEIAKKQAGEPNTSYAIVGTGNYFDKTWMDANFNSSDLYQYRIRAKYTDTKGISYSDWTDPVTSIVINCTGITPPAAPTLNHAGTNAGVMSADWTDNAPTNTSDGFIVDFKDFRDGGDDFSIFNVFEGEITDATCDFTDYKGKVLDIRVRVYVNHPDNGVCPSARSNQKLIYPLLDPYGGNAVFLSNGNIYIKWLNPNWIFGYFVGQYNHTGNPEDEWIDLNLPHVENVKEKYHNSPTEDECAFFYRIKHKTINDNDSSNWYYIEEPALREGCVISDLEIFGDGTVTFCPWDDIPFITLTAVIRNFVNPFISWLPGTSTNTTLKVGQSGKFTVVVEDQPGGPEPMSLVKEATTRQSDSTVKKKTASAWCWFIPRMCSRDPNEIIGPAGYGETNFIAEEPVLPYQILFENDPEFATVPAQKVTIIQPVDTNADLTSFRLGEFGFRNFTFSVPENRTFYSARLDLTDSIDLLVDIVAGIDVDKREVFWKFSSIDPKTGLVPTDATKGFLAINDSLHHGEGFVNYTIKSKQSVSTFDSIKALATIVFDDNESILTNEAFNVFDVDAPNSFISGDMQFSRNQTKLTTNGTDIGSGIAYYDIFVSEDNGPFNLQMTNSLDTSINFTGKNGSLYSMFSIATDNVGNREPIKNTPDIRFVIPEPDCKPSVLAEGVANGLIFSYFANLPSDSPNFDTLHPAETGHVSHLNEISNNQENLYGYSFTGYININETGEYTLLINNPVNSKTAIYLNDTLIVANDSGNVCLYEGLHPLKINYQGKGAFDFNWQYKGPWIDKQTVPDSLLYYINSAPSDIILSNDSITEQQPLETYIGELSTIDPEGGPFDYLLKDTLDNNNFVILGNNLYSNAVFDYDLQNLFTVLISSEDDEGMSLEKEFSIKIREKTEDTIPSVITEDDAIEQNRHWPNHSEQWVHIYPIPVNNHDLNIKYYKPENGKVKIKIQSVSGTLIKTYSFRKMSSVFSESINFSSFPEGFYMLEIHQGDEVYKQAIIK